MIKNEKDLIKQIKEILYKKNFSQRAKKKLVISIVSAYENYNPPKYIKKGRNEYIEEYLKVLENTNEYDSFELLQLNSDNIAVNYFKKHIMNCSTEGNLDFVDNKYIPKKNGHYFTDCLGFAIRNEKKFFTLNYRNEFSNIHHEMTHLSEGEDPFPMGLWKPFSFELRKMFVEGRAATHEYYTFKGNHVYNNFLGNETENYIINSNYAYPLYAYIYQLLQIIFGDEILEEMAKNNNLEKDMIKELEVRFPNIPVKELFTHIIYIICCELYNIIELTDELTKAVDEVKKIENWILYHMENEKNEENINKLKANRDERIPSSTLEKIWLKNPSLSNSFNFLKNTAIKVIDSEVNKNTKITPAILDKIKVLKTWENKINLRNNVDTIDEGINIRIV